MAIITVKELGKIVGKSHAWMITYRTKGRILCTEDNPDLLETREPKNLAFIKKWAPESSFAQEEPLEVGKKKKSRKKSDESDLPQVATPLDKFDIEVKKKAADLEKTQADIRILKLKEEKLRGEIVPIQIVKGIIEVMNRSVLTAMKDATDDMLLRISSEYRMPPEVLAKLRGQQIAVLNSAMEKAVGVAKKSVAMIAGEFSETRGVGEHD